LVKQKEEGLKRRLRGVEMIDRGIAREGCEVFADGKKVGVVTTGYYSPTLKKNIALALIDFEYSEMGREIEVLIRNKHKKAKIVSKKFYKKNYKK
jgi:glycine cleavage system T protein (aminomethyltransferase)